MVTGKLAGILENAEQRRLDCKKGTRDLRIDCLKAIGILSIILAHTISRDNVLYQLRTFDVPLMVIASGTLFFYSSQNKSYSFWSYLQSRLPRLLAPVWLFTVFFFSSMYCIYLLIGETFPFSWKDFFDSLLLAGGIRYFWIIKVFVLVAIAAPLMLQLYRKLRSNASFLTCLVIIYGIYSITQYLVSTRQIYPPGFLNYPLQEYLFYAAPYSCLFGLGIVIPNLRRKQLLAIAGIFLCIYLGLFLYSFVQVGIPISADSLKYPPRFYYFAYGGSLSILLLLGVDQCLKFSGNALKKHPIALRSITFLSASSLWIYLWHIFFLRLFSLFPLQISSGNFLLFLAIASLSIATTFFQKQFVKAIIRKTNLGQQNADLLTTLFLK